MDWRRILIYLRTATQKRWNGLKNKGSQDLFTKKAGITASLFVFLCLLSIMPATHVSMCDCLTGVIHAVDSCYDGRLDAAIPFDRLGHAHQRMLDDFTHP